MICDVHGNEVCPLWCFAIMSKFECTPPHHFLCPITLDPMVSPVTDEYGFTFEKAALEQNLKHRNFLCPSTGQRYKYDQLKTNFPVSQTVRHCMIRWWLDWYYELPFFTNSLTPTKPSSGYGYPFRNLRRDIDDLDREKFRRRMNNAVRNERADVEIIESTDSDYVDQLEA